MGGHYYWYFVEYQPDIQIALQDLRKREFEAGRYNPLNPFPFDVDLNERVKVISSSTDLYPNIEADVEAADADGTRSILDIFQVSDSPDFCVTCPFPTENLLRLFGTDKPERELIESVVLEEKPLYFWVDGYDMLEDFWRTIGRGESRYIVVYKDDKPSEIFFVGYSFD